MANERKLFSRVRGETETRDVLHSSGFAKAYDEHYGGDGCGDTPGAAVSTRPAGGLLAAAGQRASGTFSSQRAADERRRYVKGYENARLMRGAHVAERARAYIPRSGSSFGGRDTSGDGFSGSLIGRRIPN